MSTLNFFRNLPAEQWYRAVVAGLDTIHLRGVPCNKGSVFNPNTIGLYGKFIAMIAYMSLATATEWSYFAHIPISARQPRHLFSLQVYHTALYQASPLVLCATINNSSTKESLLCAVILQVDVVPWWQSNTSFRLHSKPETRWHSGNDTQ